MGTYRLTEDAKADLIRIYQRGLLEFGEAQADDYYNAFLTDLSFSRSSRYRIPPSTVLELDIGAVCAALTAFIIEFRGKSWKSWRLLVSRTLMAGYDLGRQPTFCRQQSCVVVHSGAN